MVQHESCIINSLNKIIKINKREQQKKNPEKAMKKRAHNDHNFIKQSITSIVDDLANPKETKLLLKCR